MCDNEKNYEHLFADHLAEQAKEALEADNDLTNCAFLIKKELSIGPLPLVSKKEFYDTFESLGNYAKRKGAHGVVLILRCLGKFAESAEEMEKMIKENVFKNMPPKHERNEGFVILWTNFESKKNGGDAYMYSFDLEHRPNFTGKIEDIMKCDGPEDKMFQSLFEGYNAKLCECPTCSGKLDANIINKQYYKADDRAYGIDDIFLDVKQKILDGIKNTGHFTNIMFIMREDKGISPLIPIIADNNDQMIELISKVGTFAEVTNASKIALFLDCMGSEKTKVPKSGILTALYDMESDSIESEYHTYTPGKERGVVAFGEVLTGKDVEEHSQILDIIRIGRENSDRYDLLKQLFSKIADGDSDGLENIFSQMFGAPPDAGAGPIPPELPKFPETPEDLT